MMTTQEVADRLVQLCREGNYEQVLNELYHPDIVSVEAEGTPERVAKGIANIRAKHARFDAKVETMHKNIISTPLVAEQFFSVGMYMETTMKGAPGPSQMDELCVYTVQDGKIVREEFFYTPQEQPA